ncbi:nuclear transport factor 2 family protein [Amycolatopsis sp. QT-25]|uniref:nuclear transport factor 2 family protein n=1 Tax=Amycolatopsis sp. QT-25 TaxID=3034022 RepID=UPI0023EA9A27|nr:nuclear transport factor 2 family protein [Amycolatopsis sp. QT-25]WET83085.1 nuclear transport factor 2 family protein [Amycolatopsis sp. QT-25]
MTQAVVSHEIMAEIQDFYARQVQAMDNGRYAEFAQTFADDCEFTPVKHQSTAHGRQAIVRKLDDFAKQLAGNGERRRHWMSMSVIKEGGPGRYDVVSYALVTNTAPGEPPKLHWAGEIVDSLVRENGELLVLRRAVNSDSIA